MAINVDSWRGRRVFLTGHTGFKGGWLSLLLSELGAEVYGYALNPNSSPNFFDVADVQAHLSADTRADIRQQDRLTQALQAAAPEIVFHLAAQPLVIESYNSPIETYEVNALGTAYLLQAVRQVSGIRAVIVVTTDKCYENRETNIPYREGDPLGGRDPYSSSKACAEIITHAYKESFFLNPGTPRVSIASARAGNVIGGGDWSADRLIPDCIRAFVAKEPLLLRYPAAIRPWQHVLEPLIGYIALAEGLLGENFSRYEGAWNFGPRPTDEASVGEVVRQVAEFWGDTAQVNYAPATRYEAKLLRLDIDKAESALGWHPQWPLSRAIQETVTWYRAWQQRQNLAEVSLEQIRAYLRESEIGGG